jgi:hypothetical protein
VKDIDSQRVDGKFVTAGGEVPAGNEDIVGLLEKCLLWAEIVLSRSVLGRKCRSWNHTDSK